MRFSFLQKILHYLPYYLKARTRYDLHSPFIFEFDTRVLPDKKDCGECREIESLRNALKKDDRVIEAQDFGAGKGNDCPSARVRKISEIIQNAAVNPKYGRLLFRIAGWLKPRNILELGTSAGIGTLYLALGNKSAMVITIEGSEAVASLANDNFSRLKVKNIHLITGNFDLVLPDLMKNNPVFDLVYIDGNHKYEATLRYYHLLKSYVNNEGLIIFDDIHWSEGMERAWSEIRSYPEITASVDLFQFGLVFFNKRLTKQHFILRY